MTAQPVASQPPRQPPSGRAQLRLVKPAALTLQWEPFGKIARELWPLFKQHWAEIALNQDSIALDPDWERYAAYELTGILHVLTARRGGKLAGYIFCCVGPHLHYVSTQWAMIDMYWLAPEERKGWAAYSMFKATLLRMRELGAKVVHASEKITFKNHNERTVGFIFHRLGFRLIEQTWAMKL